MKPIAMANMLPTPAIYLCLSQDEFEKTCKRNGLVPVGEWIKNPQCHATAHTFGGDTVVCMRDPGERPHHEIFGLLIHEAVHIGQEWCDVYGESSPGREQEAYAIQCFSQSLICAYLERVKK